MNSSKKFDKYDLILCVKSQWIAYLEISDHSPIVQFWILTKTSKFLHIPLIIPRVVITEHTNHAREVLCGCTPSKQ